MQKFKNILDQSTKVISILAIVAFVFAAWFAIQFAKSKTKKEFDARQTYFNEVHQHFNKDWAKNAYWDSVKVEKFSMIAQNGDVWNYEFSKLKFNDQFNVSTSTLERPDLYDVLQMRIAKQQNDTILRADISSLCMNTLVLHKMTFAGIVPSGITYKTYTNQKSIISMKYDSFKDKEGIAEKVFEKDIMFIDQLPFVLRSYKTEDTSTFSIKILESQLMPGTGKFNVYTGKVNLQELKDTEYTIQILLSNNQTLLYTFERNYPNKLLSMIIDQKKYTRQP